MAVKNQESAGSKLFGQKIRSIFNSGVSSRQEAAECFTIDYSERSQIVDEFKKIINDHNKTISGDTIADCYFNEKIRSKTLLMVGLGKNVRGSLQYILNEVNHSTSFEGFRVYVRTSAATDEIVRNYIAQNNWHRTETVLDSKQYSQLMESAQYLLTEVYFPESWVKKEGQVYINIWHGTPLKKLGLAKNSKNCQVNGIVQRNFIDADYLLYPNDYTREKMLDSYKVSPLMTGKILKLGYPRTGGLLESSKNNDTHLYELLAPNNEKLYAYMPTFRDYQTVEETVEQVCGLLDYLDQNLTSNQILYVNLHHKVNDSIDYSKYLHIKQFPENVDSYQLLALTEALITDYSSVFFDYLVLRKQIILFLEDYATYKEKRGMYIDVLDFPFDKAYSKEEVLQAMNTGKNYDDEEVFKEFCPYDSAQNAKMLCQLLNNNTCGLELDTIETAPKRTVLLYSNLCQQGASTEMLYQLSDKYDRTQNEIYIGCDIKKVEKHKQSAYPLLFDNPAIGTEGNPHLSAMGKAVKELYMDGKLSFEKAMEYLKYDYSLIHKRMFGKAKIDMVVIYDVDEPDRILALTAMSVEKILFLQEGMLNKMLSGDKFLKDSIRYAAKYCKGIYVLSKKDKKAARKIFGFRFASNIQMVLSAEQMEQLIK